MVARAARTAVVGLLVALAGGAVAFFLSGAWFPFPHDPGPPDNPSPYIGMGRGVADDSDVIYVASDPADQVRHVGVYAEYGYDPLWSISGTSELTSVVVGTVPPGWSEDHPLVGPLPERVSLSADATCGGSESPVDIDRTRLTPGVITVGADTEGVLHTMSETAFRSQRSLETCAEYDRRIAVAHEPQRRAELVGKWGLAWAGLWLVVTIVLARRSTPSGPEVSPQPSRRGCVTWSLIAASSLLAVSAFSACGAGDSAPPRAADPPVGFGDGVHKVGTDVQAGTWYRAGEFLNGICMWQRLSGSIGGPEEVIGSGMSNGQQIVTILDIDHSFRSTDCGDWIPFDPNSSAVGWFGDGTWAVGSQVVPGKYHASDGGPASPLTNDCSWNRSSAFSGTDLDILAPHSGDDALTVEIAPSDVAFTSSNCGIWHKI